MNTISLAPTIKIRNLVVLLLASIGCLQSVEAFNAVKTKSPSFGSCTKASRTHHYHLSGIVVSSSSEGVENEIESSTLEDTEVEEEIDWDWKKVTQSVFAGEDKRPVILFDGVCNLCNGGVNFALDHDKVGKSFFIIYLD